MKIACPNCQESIPTGQLDVATDVGTCLDCDETFSLSAVVMRERAMWFDLRRPPPGAWYEATETGWRIGATTRTPGAFFAVPFTLVWTSGALGITLALQIHNGFNIWLSLWGFLAMVASKFLWRMALMTVCGKIEVTVDGDDGYIFTGFRRSGTTESFAWETITAVEEDIDGDGKSRHRWPVIALVGESRIKFGAELSEARRYFVLRGLQKLLAERWSEKHGEL
jgi:hypothetical protein